MRYACAILWLVFNGCARTDIYYPSDGKMTIEGKLPHNRAVVLNGSDSLGNTVIDVTRNGVRYSSAGGIDNSTSTREGYRTVRHGVGTAATAAVVGIGLSQAASAYSANQAQVATSNAAASKAASATAASNAQRAVQLAEIKARAAAAAARAATAVPAAGSVIPSVIPATVAPIAP